MSEKFQRLKDEEDKADNNSDISSSNNGISISMDLSKSTDRLGASDDSIKVEFSVDPVYNYPSSNDANYEEDEEPPPTELEPSPKAAKSMERDDTITCFFGLTRYQFLVLFSAWVGWGFDLFDSLLFTYAAPVCIPYLLGLDPTLQEARDKIALWTAILTSLLLLGWAAGGILFGVICDKIGRARTMFFTIVTYSISTALCAASWNIWILAVFRFTSALGIGGEWAAGASLVAETLPERKRILGGVILYTAAPIGGLLGFLVNLVFTSSISDDAGALEDLKQQYYDDEAREVALGQFSGILGDRVMSIVTGGAATSPEVLSFMKRCFKCSVDDSYGATEVGAITSGFRAKNFVETKLVPWEEYSPEDKPFPRGELCVKSPYMSAGYYKNEEKTKEVFVDGWYHTGDIVEQAQDTYKIIDRKKNIFKLAQGEFVAPSRLENYFVESPFIDQVYVHGDALKSFLLAVVVPNEEVAQQWCKSHEKDGLTIAEICKDQMFIEEIHKDIIRIGAKNKMRNFEIPFGVILTSEKFTESNGMLNSNFKIVRNAIAKRYKSALATLYVEYESKQGSVQDKLLQILSSAIGIDGTALDSTVDFKKAPLLHLGTDSLSAIKIQNMLKSNLNIEVPISVIVAEGANIEKLANYVNSPQVDPMDSFDLDKELEHSFFMLSPPHDGTSDASGGTIAKSGKVLLTGSCGFLGVQLLHDLLVEGKTVYCLLRKSKTLDGLDRIKERFNFAKFKWHDDFDSRVIPLSGDLSLPLLGFENYLQLADEIEEVYHVAAYVNSVLPYFSLKKSNVEGTKHIVNFCLNGRNKLLHFVSTASVCVLPETRVEEMPVYRQGTPLYKMMGGYNLSKFVAERFVWKIIKEGDLKAVIYRPGMISSNTTTGYCNLDDFDNRLLVGLLQCKQVPINVHASMESNPVDFVSRTILTIAKQESSIGRVFNLVNPNKLNFDKQIKLLAQKVSDLQMLPYETWKNQVLPKLGEDNPIYPMIQEYFGRRSWFPARDSTVDCTNTEKLLQQFNEQFVEISDEVLNRWFDFVIDHTHG